MPCAKKSLTEDQIIQEISRQKKENCRHTNLCGERKKKEHQNGHAETD